MPQAHSDGRAEETDLIRYEIYTEPGVGERLVHGQGAVSLSAPTGASTLDLARLRAQITGDRLSAEQCYEALRALGIRHGPSLQGLDEVFCGTGQVLARLRPPAAVGDLALHPMILDTALQAAFFLLMEEGDSGMRLPFTLTELELFRPGTTPAWAWLRRTGKVGQLDIDLCDEQGNVCIRFTRAVIPRPSRARHGASLAARAMLGGKGRWAGTARFDRHLVVLVWNGCPGPERHRGRDRGLPLPGAPGDGPAHRGALPKPRRPGLRGRPGTARTKQVTPPSAPGRVPDTRPGTALRGPGGIPVYRHSGEPRNHRPTG